MLLKLWSLFINKAVQSVKMEVIPLPSSEAQLTYNLVGQREEIPNSSSVSRSVWCELCRIECNSVQDYKKHLSGKKHAKVLLNLNARALKAAAEKTAGSGGSVAEVVYSHHHIAKEQAIVSLENSNPISMKTQESTAPFNQTKKRKNEESSHAWCDVCKISCTSIDGLQMHLLGKKHRKNLQKLLNNDTTNLSAGVSGTTGAPNPPKPPQAMTIGQTDEVHTKKQKILQSGTVASDLRTCTTCSVVCNSDIVFKAHLAGQKHAAAMVKQARGPKVGLQTLYPAM